MQPNFRTSAIYLLLIFCGIYFFELSSFPLSTDEELAALRTDPSVWVAQGRWGAYLLEMFLLQQPTMPFVAPALFGLGCVASYLIVIKLVRPDAEFLTANDYFLFPIFCAFPTWFFLSEFYSNIGSIGVALAACTLSVWLTLGHRRPATPVVFGAIVCGAFAISIYQSFILGIPVMGAGIILARTWRNNEPINRQDLVLLVTLIIGASIAYAAGNFVFKFFIPAQNAYFDGILQIGEFFANPVVIIGRTLDTVGGVYGFNQRTYQGMLWAVPALLLLGGFSAILENGWSKERRSVILICALGILLAPFAMDLLGAGRLPIRSLVAVPFAVWLFGYFALESRRQWIRMASSVFLGIFIFQTVVIHNSYQATELFVGRHDALMAASVYDQIAASPGFDAAKTYPIAIFGSLSFVTVYPQPPSSTIGQSFFHDNPWRIASYMKLLGYSKVSGPTLEQIDNTIVEASRMPVWPTPGSVIIKNDVALLRLSDEPSADNRAALQRAKAANP